MNLNSSLKMIYCTEYCSSLYLGNAMGSKLDLDTEIF